MKLLGTGVSPRKVPKGRKGLAIVGTRGNTTARCREFRAIETIEMGQKKSFLVPIRVGGEKHERRVEQSVKRVLSCRGEGGGRRGRGTLCVKAPENGIIH